MSLKSQGSTKKKFKKITINVTALVKEAPHLHKALAQLRHDGTDDNGGKMVSNQNLFCR